MDIFDACLVVKKIANCYGECVESLYSEIPLVMVRRDYSTYRAFAQDEPSAEIFDKNIYDIVS